MFIKKTKTIPYCYTFPKSSINISVSGARYHLSPFKEVEEEEERRQRESNQCMSLSLSIEFLLFDLLYLFSLINIILLFANNKGMCVFVFNVA